MCAARTRDFRVAVIIIIINSNNNNYCCCYYSNIQDRKYTHMAI